MEKKDIFLGDTEPYDAVVLDLGLPKVDGISVLENGEKKKFSCSDSYCKRSME